MKKFAKDVLLVSIPTLVMIALILEMVFRTIIPASNTPLTHFDEKHGIYKYHESNREGLYTAGPLAQQRGHWRINNHGWNSEIDYFVKKEKVRIAIIGDSYIEAFQVDVDESYPALLRADIGTEYDVYSFGISGAPLSQYLQMSRYVTNVFDPDLLIFNIVHNDFYESLYSHSLNNVHWLRLDIEDEKIREIHPEPNYSSAEFSPIKRYWQGSALIRYLFHNLRTAEGRYAANVDVGILSDTKKEVRLATRYVLEKIRLENPERRIIFLMDAHKNGIYENTQNEELNFLHEIMRIYCSEFSFEFIDLSKIMRKEYRKNGRKFNSEYDGHWDEYGHEFVYKNIAELL